MYTNQQIYIHIYLYIQMYVYINMKSNILITHGRQDTTRAEICIL